MSKKHKLNFQAKLKEGVGVKFEYIVKVLIPRHGCEKGQKRAMNIYYFMHLLKLEFNCTACVHDNEILFSSRFFMKPSAYVREKKLNKIGF